LSDELIRLVVAGNVDEFNTLMEVYDRDANLIAKMITLWRNEFATKLNKSIDEVRDVLSERTLEKILEKVRGRKLDVGDIKPAMLKILEGVSFTEAIKVEKIDDDQIEEEIRKIIKEKPGLRENAYMGLVMKKFGGKIDARRAAQIIKKIIQ